MKRKMLLVEDNVLLAEVVVDAFDLIGFDVHAVRHGTDAIALAQDRDFDAALIDLELGEGPTGLEVATAIQKLRPDMVVVLSTGYDASTVDPELGVPVVGKPYRPDEIARLLTEHTSAPTAHPEMRPLA